MQKFGPIFKDPKSLHEIVATALSHGNADLLYHAIRDADNYDSKKLNTYNKYIKFIDMTYRKYAIDRCMGKCNPYPYMKDV